MGYQSRCFAGRILIRHTSLVRIREQANKITSECSGVPIEQVNHSEGKNDNIVVHVLVSGNESYSATFCTRVCLSEDRAGSQTQSPNLDLLTIEPDVIRNVLYQCFVFVQYKNVRSTCPTHRPL